MDKTSNCCTLNLNLRGTRFIIGNCWTQTTSAQSTSDEIAALSCASEVQKFSDFTGFGKIGNMNITRKEPDTYIIESEKSDSTGFKSGWGTNRQNEYYIYANYWDKKSNDYGVRIEADIAPNTCNLAKLHLVLQFPNRKSDKRKYAVHDYDAECEATDKHYSEAAKDDESSIYITAFMYCNDVKNLIEGDS